MKKSKIRFPAYFMFELIESDIDKMVSQVVIPFIIIREFAEINEILYDRRYSKKRFD